MLLEVFDGRVDVTSPGALPNHMTVERVRAGANPRSRNDAMAYFMAAMGFMEQRGRGWLIMQREMREFNGNGAGTHARRTQQVRPRNLPPDSILTATTTTANRHKHQVGELDRSDARRDDGKLSKLLIGFPTMNRKPCSILYVVVCPKPEDQN